MGKMKAFAMRFPQQGMKLVECDECGGEGRAEYEEAVVDYNHGGYLKGVMRDCEKCGGYGELEIEDA